MEANNLPARALYDAIGLKRELYRYHYRRESRRSRGEVHYSAVSSTSSKTLVSSRRRPGWGVIPARNTRLVDEIKAELAEAAEHSQQTGESARRPPSLARVLDAIPCAPRLRGQERDARRIQVGEELLLLRASAREG